MNEMDFQELREKALMSHEDVANLTGYSLSTVYRWESGKAQPRKGIVDLIGSIAARNEERLKRNNPAEFTFIDLFAGIGGIRLGFERAGGKCVFTSEMDKYARQTYHANFGCDHEVAGDITKVDASDIPQHDVLLAGFPCQPFSIAGVSKKNSLGRQHGFADKTKGTLFFDVARIIEHHRPSAFLLENVKNLASHDKGNTLKVIRETLNELGYTLSIRIIDAKGYVPQHRERVYIAGFRTNSNFSLDDIEVVPALEGPRLKTILHPQDGSEGMESPYTLGEDGVINDKYTLTPKLWSYLKQYAAKHKAKGNGFGYGLVGPENTARTLSARYYKDGSEILIRQDDNRPRRLTPRECARLMGFDGPGESNFRIPVSDTQSYKQFGNSVAVPVIELIARHMKPYILEGKKVMMDSKVEEING